MLSCCFPGRADNEAGRETTAQPVTSPTTADSDDVYYCSVKDQPAGEATRDNSSREQTTGATGAKQGGSQAASQAESDYVNTLLKVATKDETYEIVDSGNEYGRLNDPDLVRKQASGADDTYDRATK